MSTSGRLAWLSNWFEDNTKLHAVSRGALITDFLKVSRGHLLAVFYQQDTPKFAHLCMWIHCLRRHVSCQSWFCTTSFFGIQGNQTAAEYIADVASRSHRFNGFNLIAATLDGRNHNHVQHSKNCGEEPQNGSDATVDMWYTRNRGPPCGSWRVRHVGKTHVGATTSRQHDVQFLQREDNGSHWDSIENRQEYETANQLETVSSNGRTGDDDGREAVGCCIGPVHVEPVEAGLHCLSNCELDSSSVPKASDVHQQDRSTKCRRNSDGRICTRPSSVFSKHVCVPGYASL